jgi:hypothetical protein
MMLLDWLGLVCALLSAVCIAALAALDPKRRGAGSARPGLRRMLAFAAIVPGLGLGICGRWTDFLIWIGAAAILGWAIAAAVNLRTKRGPRP